VTNQQKSRCPRSVFGSWQASTRMKANYPSTVLLPLLLISTIDFHIIQAQC